MTNDRDEEFLRTKLTDGLHPAEVDLWPAVAEALPNARPHGPGGVSPSAWLRRC